MSVSLLAVHRVFGGRHTCSIEQVRRAQSQHSFLRGRRQLLHTERDLMPKKIWMMTTMHFGNIHFIVHWIHLYDPGVIDLLAMTTMFAMPNTSLNSKSPRSCT